MIKMIVLDIDGTILGKSLKLTQNLKDCFAKIMQKGIKIVLATGRMYRAAVYIAEELKLDTPIICSQGGCVRNFNGNDDMLREVLLPQSTVSELLETIKEKNIHINLYANDTLYVENDNDIIKRYIVHSKVPYQVVENLDALHFEGYEKVLAINYDPEKIDTLGKLLQKKYEGKLYIINSTPHFCEISNIKATKGEAVKFLADMWGIKKDEIMAIGDQNNDIEMLLAAGTKIAMGNAVQALKDVADFVTLDVEEDGVCHAIEKYITM